MVAMAKHPSNGVAGDPAVPPHHGVSEAGGLAVGKDRVERIWRREGLKVPQKQKPRGRLWLNEKLHVASNPYICTNEECC